MTDAPIGRLLVAPLHQAITDVLPQRIDFYEYWLHGEGLRGGTIGLAPMTAVLGFLRAEGEPYDRVMTAAGRLAAEWTVDGMPALRRRLMASLPRAWRLRAALRVVRSVIRLGYHPSRTTLKVRRGTARLEVHDSIFCHVREAQKQPLCAYHAALAVELLARFDLPADCRIESCRASGGAGCVLIVTLCDAGPAQ
jgi:hypothetical protein